MWHASAFSQCLIIDHNLSVKNSHINDKSRVVIALRFFMSLNCPCGKLPSTIIANISITLMMLGSASNQGVMWRSSRWKGREVGQCFDRLGAGERPGFYRTKGDRSGHYSLENKTEKKKNLMCALYCAVSAGLEAQGRKDEAIPDSMFYIFERLSSKLYRGGMRCSMENGFFACVIFHHFA